MIYHRKAMDDIQPRRGWWYAKPAAWIKKEVTFGRQKLLLFWSRVRESNPPSRLGKPLYYRYTNPANGDSIITKAYGKSKRLLSKVKFRFIEPGCPGRQCVHSAAVIVTPLGVLGIFTSLNSDLSMRVVGAINDRPPNYMQANNWNFRRK